MRATFKARTTVDHLLTSLFGNDIDLDVHDTIHEFGEEEITLYPELNAFVMKGYPTVGSSRTTSSEDKHNILVLTEDPSIEHQPDAFFRFLFAATKNQSSMEFIKGVHAIVKAHSPKMTEIPLRLQVLDTVIESDPRTRIPVTIISGMMMRPIEGGGKATKRKHIIEKGIDILELDALCNSKLELTYLVSSTRFYATKHLLVLLAYDHHTEKLRGIRLTKISPPNVQTARAFILGSYMCSNGLGKLLQAATEDTIRNHYGAIFERTQQHSTADSITTVRRTRQAKTPKTVTFRLYAVPSAVTFWQDVGFVNMGQMKGISTLMEKQISVDDRGSGNLRT